MYWTDLNNKCLFNHHIQMTVDCYSKASVNISWKYPIVVPKMHNVKVFIWSEILHYLILIWSCDPCCFFTKTASDHWYTSIILLCICRLLRSTAAPLALSHTLNKFNICCYVMSHLSKRQFLLYLLQIYASFNCYLNHAQETRMQYLLYISINHAPFIQ